MGSAQRKLPQPSVALLSWPSSPSYQSEEVTGATRSANLILFPARSQASVVLSLCVLSLHLVVLVLLQLQYQRNYFRWLVLKIVIQVPEARQPPLVISPRQPMLLLARPMPT